MPVHDYIPSNSTSHLLMQLYDEALEEVIDSIRTRLSAGATPSKSSVPEISIRENGMPSISNPMSFAKNGPLDFSSVLEPPWNDEDARRAGKFPNERFPHLAKLKEFLVSKPELHSLIITIPTTSNSLLLLMIEHQVKDAADVYFLRFGEIVNRPGFAGDRLV